MGTRAQLTVVDALRDRIENSMSGQYILAHDLGTMGDEVTLWDLEGHLVASVTVSYPTYHPRPTWAEQNS